MLWDNGFTLRMGRNDNEEILVMSDATNSVAAAENAGTVRKAEKVNYSKELEREIVARYRAAGVEGHEGDAARSREIARIADETGKSVASVRQKLVTLGEYRKPAKVTKNGQPSVSKADLVDRLAEVCGKDSDFMGSAEKANKAVLVALLVTFHNMQQQIDAVREGLPDATTET